MNIKDIKPNPNNPRIIKDDKFKKLVQSIKEFPKMMELRPIIVDENNIIQGGNMRYKALQELGYKDIPDEWVKQGKDLTPDQWKEFVIKDNVGFGEWDMQILSNDWNADLLIEWGIEIVPFKNNVEEEHSDISEQIEIQYKIEISCVSEQEQEILYNEFIKREIECRLLTL